jgi:hypothetical protein
MTTVSWFVVFIIRAFAKPPAVVVGSPIFIGNTATPGIGLAIPFAFAPQPVSPGVIIPLFVKFVSVSTHCSLPAEN